ncbi:C-type lectin domain family 9 member A-like isoform X1 [Aix galericulata]|nr:C-type lectin domain family 9 member A-like isoform X1 [Aix galericulata]
MAMRLESCNVMLQAPELRHWSISVHGPKLCTSTWTSAPPQGAVSGGRASPAWVWARAKGAGGCPAWWLQPSSPWLWAMEDEEGYTVLKFGAKRSAPRRQQGGGMAGSPRCQNLVASAGWALSTGLAIAVITLGLRDGRGCRLCPRDWLQHGNWCYWVSHESRDWQRSRDDCAQKGSALFIIRNREQMQVLQDVTQGRGYVWIGLAVTGAKGTWTWLDGSVLDTKQFRILGLATSGSCALIKDSQIRSEGCNAESRWVCEKDAVAL